MAVTVVLVGHGGLPQGMLAAAELILGPQEGVHAIGLEPGDDPAALAGRLAALLRGARGDDGPGSEGSDARGTGAAGGVLVLADLFGGSPANAAARLLLEGGPGAEVRVVTGLNLPMLLEVLMARLQGETGVAELARRAAEAGRDGVRDLQDILGS